MSTPDRGPVDYPEWDDERKILINIIRRQTERGGGSNYTEGGGERTLLKWLLGLSASLLVVSVVGVVTMYGKLSAVEANQSSQQRQIDQLADSVKQLAGRP
jgi:cytochrome c-type biogenesis protein CcmH/NrfG